MKTISLRGYTFLLDDDVYEQYKDLNFTVNLCRKTKPYLMVRALGQNKYTYFGKVIINSPNRVIYKDSNTLNLQKSNLEINTPERRLLKKQDKYKYKAYYEKNKLKIAAAAKIYFQENKEHKLELQKEYRKRVNYINDKKYHRTLKGKYNNLIHCNAKRAKKGRILGIDLTLEQYDDIIKKSCYYCSKDLFLETGGSLDRIDNSKGYLIDNVLPCCGFCNKLRQDLMTVDETKHVVSALIKYRKQRDK